MAEQYVSDPKAILTGFIESVLQKRQIGRIGALCFHRVRLFTGCSRQYYSVPAVQEQILKYFSDFPDLQFEVRQLITDADSKDGAAAVVQLITSGRESTGFIMARTAGSRITSLRFIFDLQSCREDTRPAGNVQPSAEVIVSAVPHQVYHEGTVHPVVEDHLYQLAGLPRTAPTEEAECSRDLTACSLPGSVYLAEMMGEPVGSGRHACLLAWYKGMLSSQGQVSISGISYLEFDAQGLQRDLRVFDDSLLYGPDEDLEAELEGIPEEA